MLFDDEVKLLTILAFGLTVQSQSLAAETSSRSGEATVRSPTDPQPINEAQQKQEPAATNAASQAGYTYPGRNFGWWDALALGVVQGLYFLVEYTQDGPENADWTGAVPVSDQPFRNWVVAKTRKLRERADRASDYFWYASVSYPFAANTILPLVRGSSLNAPQDSVLSS